MNLEHFRVERSPRQSSEAFRAVVRRDPCSYCGRPGGESDHITPQSDYGIRIDVNAWDNFTGACRSCNARKGAQSLLGFLLPGPVGRHMWGGRPAEWFRGIKSPDKELRAPTGESFEARRCA